MLQLNNGDGTFSEVGQQMKISNTDWSWSALFADFNNDSWQDLFVSNGYKRDYTNRDFLSYMENFFSVKDVKDMQALLKKALEVKANPLANETLGKHKTLGLIFYNSSLRTRISSQKAAYNLGMDVITLNVNILFYLELVQDNYIY